MTSIFGIFDIRSINDIKDINIKKIRHDGLNQFVDIEIDGEVYWYDVGQCSTAFAQHVLPIELKISENDDPRKVLDRFFKLLILK